MMYNNKYILIGIFTFLSLIACEDYIGGDINADPNSPVTVPVTAQLPAFQIATADVYGGAFSRFNCMLSQQVEGVARQWSSFNQYTGLTPNRFDAAWNNIYENILNELQIARASAQTSGFNHHEAIVDVNEAFALLIAADVWDNIPYTTAFQGIAEANPSYDDQASVYSAALSLLDGALSKFNGSAGSVAPGNEDVFYQGDINKWKAAVNAIKARALLHQGNYDAAMNAATNSFANASENLSYQYPDANSAGHWYRFNRDRTGDLEFHPTMRSIMTDLNDSMRLSIFDKTFITEHPYMVPDFLQELVTYREMQFIIAECAFRTGDNAMAHAAYLNGIRASFARVGVGGFDEYVAQAIVDPGADGLSLEIILTQKYIGLFLDPQVYNDYRRTGIPNLVPVSSPAVPVRWDYPSTEYLFNNNSPAEGSVNIYTDRVGWNR